jgi:hypothetical protein
MNRSSAGEPQGDAIGVDPSSAELQRLAWVDALLRVVAARDRRETTGSSELHAVERSRTAPERGASC